MWSPEVVNSRKIEGDWQEKNRLEDPQIKNTEKDFQQRLEELGLSESFLESIESDDFDEAKQYLEGVSLGEVEK